MVNWVGPMITRVVQVDLEPDFLLIWSLSPREEMIDRGMLTKTPQVEGWRHRGNWRLQVYFPSSPFPFMPNLLGLLTTIPKLSLIQVHAWASHKDGFSYCPWKPGPYIRTAQGHATPMKVYPVLYLAHSPHWQLLLRFHTSSRITSAIRLNNAAGSFLFAVAAAVKSRYCAHLHALLFFRWNLCLF